VEAVSAISHQASSPTIKAGQDLQENVQGEARERGKRPSYGVIPAKVVIRFILIFPKHFLCL
jgi:hypothetical protein